MTNQPSMTTSPITDPLELPPPSTRKEPSPPGSAPQSSPWWEWLRSVLRHVFGVDAWEQRQLIQGLRRDLDMLGQAHNAGVKLTQAAVKQLNQTTLGTSNVSRRLAFYETHVPPIRRAHMALTEAERRAARALEAERILASGPKVEQANGGPAESPPVVDAAG